MSAAPVHPQDFPDPYVLNADGHYFAYGTNAGSVNVQVMWSEDLARWLPSGDALPRLPGWAEQGFTWSPSVLAREGRFILYYSVREPRSGRQAISAAVSDRPDGPFEDHSRGPLIFQKKLGGSIDPSPFVDVDGQSYLLWKADANALQLPSTLWGQPLTSNGLSLEGSPTRLLTFEGGWEDPLIEAPAAVYERALYYLFYSANWWESSGYGIGYATADSLLGPYTKATRSGPWFGSDRDVAGPGGQEFFTDNDGGLNMAYHGWEPDRIGYRNGGARTLRLARVHFDEDGIPRIGHRPAG